MRERLKSLRTVSGLGIGNGFFTESRINMYASGVALGYAVTLVLQLIGNKFRIGIDGKDCIDFTWIWLSSKFALSGVLARAYDYSVFSGTRAAIVGPPNCLLEHFDYPPTLLLFTHPLGLMLYSMAFAVRMMATLLIYLAAVYAIIPRPAAVIAALTPYPVFFNTLLGHNGFLTVGLIGLTLALMERRPWLSGIFLGPRISARRASNHADVLDRSHPTDGPDPRDHLRGLACACRTTDVAVPGSRLQRGTASRSCFTGDDGR